jgi:hypothetical protein
VVKLAVVRMAACGAWAVAFLAASTSAAVEDRVHAGLQAGFATASFPEFVVGGADASAHALYGISDAFNLRLAGDLAVYDLPDPETSALLFGALTGAEYVLDTIDWVVYAGLSAGPVFLSVQQGSDTWMLGAEVPAGVSYLLSDRFALRILEVRYRLLFLGDDTTPTGQLYFGAGLELMVQP